MNLPMQIPSPPSPQPSDYRSGQTSPEPLRQTLTTCPYCGTGCGVRVETFGATVTALDGDPQHPANHGRLCVKGSALADTLVPDGRLLHPLLQDPDSGGQRRVDWNTALDLVAGEFARIIDAHGPDAVAFYVSGQLLTEDYYVANKLMKGYIGSANIDTNSRLCMSSAVAGHKRAFGEDIVPVSYADLEQADLVVLVGSNLAWCHPVLHQRLLAAKRERPQLRIVVIDPRRTATVELADLHLPLRAGTDVRLFNALFAYLHAQGCIDADFVSTNTRGLDATLAAAQAEPVDIAAVAADCEVDALALEAFFAEFAATARVITAFSMGVNQSSTGTDKVNAIINCHLLSGRIGKPGAGPFSITGQPNAMGGREVGGLSNTLAAHLDLEDPLHRTLVQTFWNSPRIAQHAGLKAVDLFRAIEAGQVKAVWIIGTNPVVSLPDADQTIRALRAAELVVVSEVIARTDTSAYAHVLLPAPGWGEKDGTVTNSERCISRQRAFLPLPGEAQPNWWALAQVARRLGHGAHFAYDGPHAIFDEHARLTAFGNPLSSDGPAAEIGNRESGIDTTIQVPQVLRYLNLGGLAGMNRAEYDAMQPRRWPVLHSSGSEDPPEVFADGRFYTADRRARFVPTPLRAPGHAPDADYPLILNTGRVRDHWHTMTRTGLSARLSAHIDQSYAELHPEDAAAAGVEDGRLLRLHSRWGSAVVRARVSEEARRGHVFVPIHWNAQFAAAARIDAVVNPVVCPQSGEPEYKHTPVAIEPYAVNWQAFALSRQPLSTASLDWWTRVTGRAHQRYECAGREAIDWQKHARDWLDADGEGGEWLEFHDPARGIYRIARLREGRLDACLLVSTGAPLPPREWLAGLFERDWLDAEQRSSLLAARPPGARVDHGPVVCSCFGVGRTRITAAIAGGCDSVEALGEKLQCGTNCGSCIPELRALLARSPAPSRVNADAA